jgi:hypothetical protein
MEEISQEIQPEQTLQQNQEPEKKTNIWKILFIGLTVFILVILVIACYVYFFIINPAFVSKPLVEKPIMSNITLNATTNQTQQLVVLPEHILFLLNEIGAYKLHSTLDGEAPGLKFIIKDMNKEYYFQVIDNNLINIDSLPQYDLIIKSDQQTIVGVYQSENTQASIMNSYSSGQLELEVIADTYTLALKGYSSLGTYFGISGFSIFNW